MDNWVTIYTADLPQNAHMVKAYLESFELYVVIRDELTAQVDNFHSNAIGGVKLMVHKNNQQQALELLQQGGYIEARPAPIEIHEIVSL